MESVVLFAGLAFAINKTVSVIKGLSNRDANTVVTQVVVWLVGFAGLSLAAHSAVTEAYALPGFSQSLGDLDWASLVMLAWILGSSGSFIYDIKSAIDSSDSAAEDQLVS